MLNIIAAAVSTSAPVIPFAPTDIAGLKAWYDASDTASISLSGSAVTQWNDKSGNGFYQSQSTSARRPQSGVNTLNSKNVITFDGNDTLVAQTASDWTFMNNSTGCTIFMAAYYDATSVQTMIMDTSESTTGNRGITVYRQGSDVLGSFVVLGSGGDYVSNYNGTTALPDAAGAYWSIVMDNSNATAANRLIYKINGGANQSGNTFSSTASSSAPFQPLRLASYDNTGAQGFQGRMAEIIIYSGVLSSGDISTVNTYLATKWGL
jgi:hypothetical protein